MNARHLYAEQYKCNPKDQAVALSCWLKVWRSFWGDGRWRGRIGGTQRVAVGWCNNKACSHRRPALSDASSLSLSPTSYPPRCRAAKWNMRAGFFSFQSCPLRSRTPGPQRGWRELLRRRGLGWSAEPLLLWMSASYTWLTFLSTWCPPCLPPLIPLLFCCLALSCQTEKWQARQRSSAWGDGQERTEAYAHKCINGVYFRQHLSNWKHVVTLNIFSLLWLHIQMHLQLCQNFSP